MPFKFIKEIGGINEFFNRGYFLHKILFLTGSIVIAITSVYVVHSRKWQRKKKTVDSFIQGVGITSYGSIQNVQIMNIVPYPQVMYDDEVLVRVVAACVDPVDIRIALGCNHIVYHHLNYFSKHYSEGAPIILGRQCAGVVEDIGAQVNFLHVGDEVWVFSSYRQHGLMAEYVVVKDKQLAKKPSNLSFELAASFPYTAMVTWEALVKSGHLGANKTKGKRILVHAGNSAYGILAIQLIKNWGGHVTTTVPTIGLPLARYLGADDVIVYSVTNFEEELLHHKKFDVVFNIIGTVLHESCVQVCAPGGKIITLIASPLTSDADRFIFGIPMALASYMRALVVKVTHGITSSFSYGCLTFDKRILEEVKEMIEKRKVEVIVEEVYDLENAILAFQHVAADTPIGSTVIRLSTS